MSLKRQQELCLDGIETSLTMARVAYSRLELGLAWHSERTTQNLHERILDLEGLILLDAWSLIDTANRLRVLVCRAPGLEQNAFVAAFLRATEDVRKLRNFVQHLHGEMTSLEETGRTIWGSLSWLWVSPQMLKRGTVATMLMIPGRLAKSGGYPGVNPVGKRVIPPLGHICLFAADTVVNLSEISRASMLFGDRFEAALERARNTSLEYSGAVEQEAFLHIVLEA